MRIIAVLFPVLFIIGTAILSELIIKKLDSACLRGAFLSGTGLLLAWLLYLALAYFSRQLKVDTVRFGNVSGLAVGLAIGLCASFLSGVLYWKLYGNTLSVEKLSQGLFFRTISNVFPASIEEMGFRGGVVGLVTSFFGQVWGLAAGSFPFGVLHFVGRFFGNPVTIQHAMGVSVAGLLLSLLYLRFGLFAAFGCHWIWNSLCGQWVEALSIPKPGGVQAFEGAWSTTAVLTIIAIFLATQLSFTTDL